MTRLWTIGYEHAGVPALIDALRGAGIQTVLDVRELPNSRRAGFSKNILAASLAKAGIGYRHMKALGTPKAGRDAAKKGDVAAMHAIFEAKLATPESQLALLEAADIAKGEHVCLLCLEHEWRDCHRAIIANRLEAFGFKATHLAPEMDR